MVSVKIQEAQLDVFSFFVQELVAGLASLDQKNGE